jgi:lipopolysaccharide export LptBFGC system permease protein LptF
VVRVVRFGAIVIGVMFLAIAAVNVFGLAPRSDDETLSLARQIYTSLPFVVIAAALLAPYRAVRTRSLRIAGLLMLSLITAVVTFYGAWGVIAYLRGEKTWEIVPVTLAMAFAFALNTWAYVRITGHSST